MASVYIEKRKNKSGVKYRAQVIIKKNGKKITQSKTFSKKTLAQTWGRNKLDQIELEMATGTHLRNATIAELIDLYIADKDLWPKCSRSKRQTINMLRDCDIAKVFTHELTTGDLITHCRNRKDTGVCPSTINHDMSYLKHICDRAESIFNIKSNNVWKDALMMLREMGLIGKSVRRTRRPTTDELVRLEDGLKQREANRTSTKNGIPLVDILHFSILTCMRIGEVCKIKWEDLDKKNKSILVRDRKDPRKKAGNNMLVPLLGDSWDIVIRQPHAGDRIFPYNATSITAAFQRVRNKLGIEDLRYHDLRREGASRLFEMGYTIEEVAQVTGHRSLNTLWNVYTELHPKTLHDKYKNQATPKDHF